MRPVKKRPRILTAKYMEGLTVSAVFNNGETRIIDFKKVFAYVKIAKNSPAAILLKPEAFKKFKIENGTLSWKNVVQEIPWGKEIRKVPFEIGADTLYKNSQQSKLSYRLNIGELIRNERLAAQMTQDDLAVRSGTTAGYISRIESNKSGIELDTLQKLVEIGLGKKLRVSFK
jgi:Helix-turn-helix/Protein of unknown function (DUF2442)